MRKIREQYYTALYNIIQSHHQVITVYPGSAKTSPFILCKYKDELKIIICADCAMIFYGSKGFHIFYRDIKDADELYKDIIDKVDKGYSQI